MLIGMMFDWIGVVVGFGVMVCKVFVDCEVVFDGGSGDCGYW